jgi:hypothetical protein
MMKNILLLISLLFSLFEIGHAQTKESATLPDGLYLVTNLDSIPSQPVALQPHEAALKFSPLFMEYNGEENTRIIVDTTEYVPLELEKPPATEAQTERKKKLLLSLTRDASEKLKTFTADHVMRMVALVVGGDVLTMHKIRVPITSGELQITRCNDNACEKLFVKLKDRVKQ